MISQESTTKDVKLFGYFFTRRYVAYKGNDAVLGTGAYLGGALGHGPPFGSPG